jgi:methenyltetrahydrofolate cyclohydrolase
VVFLKAALISGQLNVMINLGAIKNEKFLKDTTAEMNQLAEEGSRIADQTLAAVMDKLV